MGDGTQNATNIRPGEVLLDSDPAQRGDAGVTFIGWIRSPWERRGDCPKNIARARETGRGAEIRLDPAYAPALSGLAPGQPVILLYWMHHARRDMVVQNPRHTDGPRGTFALRSPNRPNPIAMSCVIVTEIDAARGRIGIDAIDCVDGTPLVDIKPWLASVDVPPGRDGSD